MNNKPPSAPKSKGDEISDRLIDFAVSILKLIRAFPRNSVGMYIGKQLMRCALSSGANYEEARGSESSADFVHKLGITLKELKESRYWLKICHRIGLSHPPPIEECLVECEELCAIVARSILTVKSKIRSGQC